MTRVSLSQVVASRGVIRAGGIALIAGAVAFVGVFSYLAARFNYPAVLDGAAQDVLPALLSTGSAGRGAWAFYSVLPLLFIPAGVGAYEALRGRAAASMRIALLFAFLAAISMTLGLMRWPSVNWELALAWGAADADARNTLSAIFDGFNSYLGNYIGEFLGELSLNVFFVLCAAALLRHERTPRWLGWWGLATGFLGLIGLWRNVTPSVDAVSAANNYLLPAWMLGFGFWLIIASRRSATSE